MSRYAISASGGNATPRKRREFRGREKAELYNLYHIAKTALSGQDDSRWARACWAAKSFTERYPDFSRKAAYLELTEANRYE